MGDRQWVLDSVPKDRFEVIVKGARTVDFIAGNALDPFPITTPTSNESGTSDENGQKKLRGAVDVVVMKHLLSAFSDSKITTMLKNIRAVLTPKTGRVFLLQSLVTEAGEGARGGDTAKGAEAGKPAEVMHENHLCDDGMAPAACAVEIMCDCPGGRWRTGQEYRVLFEKAGFFECCRVKSKPNMTMIVYGLK